LRIGRVDDGRSPGGRCRGRSRLGRRRGAVQVYYCTSDKQRRVGGNNNNNNNNNAYSSAAGSSSRANGMNGTNDPSMTARWCIMFSTHCTTHCGGEPCGGTYDVIGGGRRFGGWRRLRQPRRARRAGREIDNYFCPNGTRLCRRSFHQVNASDETGLYSSCQTVGSG
jgi:hypothetical protein